MSAAPKLAAVPIPRLEPSEILTPQEVAARLKVPLSWIYKQVAKKPSGLPVLRCGHYLRFEWGAVVAWLRSDNAA